PVMSTQLSSLLRDLTRDLGNHKIWEMRQRPLVLAGNMRFSQLPRANGYLHESHHRRKSHPLSRFNAGQQASSQQSIARVLLQMIDKDRSVEPQAGVPAQGVLEGSHASRSCCK